MTWKHERRRQREKEWAEERERQDIERRRVENLSMYDRIEESDASPQIKDILHRMAQKMGNEHETD